MRPEIGCQKGVIRLPLHEGEGAIALFGPTNLAGQHLEGYMQVDEQQNMYCGLPCGARVED